MKKIMMALLALCFIVPCYAGNPQKDYQKALKKERAKKEKEFKKGKWEIVGSRTMEVALMKHYGKLEAEGEDAQEWFGMSRAKSKNNAIQMATNNAVVSYAQQAGSTLKGRVVTELNANGVDAAGELDNFYAAYERLVEKEIKNEMEPSFTIMRPLADGTYEVQTFYIVSESKAQKARMRALEDAMKSSEVARQHADQITDFVKQGFDN